MNLGAIQLVGAMQAQPFTTGNLLTALLTTEGLVFTAVSVSVSIGGKSAFGPKPQLPTGAMAFVAALTLVLVAVGAGLAWADLFGGKHWPSGGNSQTGAVALLVAIVVQPVLALSIAVGLVR